MKRTLFGYGLGLGVEAMIALGLVLASPAARADATQGSQTRTVGAFRAVELAGTLQVDVTAGKPASVEVVGDSDLLDRVTTVVKDGTLVIDTREMRHEHRRNSHLRVVVSVPDLTGLSLSGTGTIKATGIASDELVLRLSGTGTVAASGKAGSLRVDLSGTGDVAAKQLESKDAVVDLRGTGSARLHASRSVDARLSGTGSVKVHGHPQQVKKSVSGLGSIHID